MRRDETKRNETRQNSFFGLVFFDVCERRKKEGRKEGKVLKFYKVNGGSR